MREHCGAWLMLVGLTVCAVGMLMAECGHVWPIVMMVCGFGALVAGWLLVLPRSISTCPGCGTPTPGGLYCSECYWRTTDQDAEIEDRR